MIIHFLRFSVRHLPQFSHLTHYSQTYSTYASTKSASSLHERTDRIWCRSKGLSKASSRLFGHPSLPAFLSSIPRTYTIPDTAIVPHFLSMCSVLSQGHLDPIVIQVCSWI